MKTMIKLLTIGAIIALLVSVCGCTSNTSSPQTNLNPSTKMNTTENTTSNVTSNVTKATATVTPTATEQPTVTPTPAYVATAVPTAPSIPATNIVVNVPSSAKSSATMTVTFTVYNSVTNAPMPGVPVKIWHADTATVVTGPDGSGTHSFVTPPWPNGKSVSQLITFDVMATSTYQASHADASWTLIGTNVQGDSSWYNATVSPK